MKAAKIFSECVVVCHVIQDTQTKYLKARDLRLVKLDSSTVSSVNV